MFEKGNAQNKRSHGVLRTQKYDIIDLDPYGSAMPFLPTAIEAIEDGGKLLLLIGF